MWVIILCNEGASRLSESQFSPVFFLVVGLVCFITGISKGGLASNLGILCTPILTLILPANQAIGLLLPILIIGDWFTLVTLWKTWDSRILRRLLPGGIVGIALGTLVLSKISPLALKRGMGILVILYIIYRLVESRISRSVSGKKNGWFGFGAGTLSGFLSTVANSGGPPISIFLLTQNLQPAIFVATSAIFFGITNLIKVPSYALTGLFNWGIMIRAAWLLPLIPLGVWVGRWLARRVSKEIFDRIILVLLGIAAILLLR
jgi:uncharacterized membrane protein YfcA